MSEFAVEDALAILEKAFLFAPTHAVLNIRLIQIYLYLNQLDRLQQHLHLLAVMSVRHPVITGYTGVLMLRQGKALSGRRLCILGLMTGYRYPYAQEIALELGYHYYSSDESDGNRYPGAQGILTERKEFAGLIKGLDAWKLARDNIDAAVPAIEKAISTEELWNAFLKTSWSVLLNLKGNHERAVKVFEIGPKPVYLSARYYLDAVKKTGRSINSNLLKNIEHTLRSQSNQTY
jgi:hypothetical protein